MREQTSPGVNAFRTFVAAMIVVVAAIDGTVLVTSDDGATTAGQLPDERGPEERDPPEPDTSQPIEEPSVLLTPLEEPTLVAEPDVVFPVSASASGSAPTIEGPGGETLTYGPELAIDGLNETAWCVPGEGAGEFLRVELGSAYDVTHIGIIPGYDKIDPTTGEDRFKENRKIVEVIYSFAGGTPLIESFSPPLREIKVTELPQPVGTTFIQIEPSFTTGFTDPDRNYTCISEVVVAGLIP